jgi:hypothetical protein
MTVKIELLTFCLRRLGVTPPPEVVVVASRKFREPTDFIFSELEEVSWMLGLPPLRGPSCQTWFTVVKLLSSVSVANIVISLFSNVAERFETPKLKSPSASVVHMQSQGMCMRGWLNWSFDRPQGLVLLPFLFL